MASKRKKLFISLIFLILLPVGLILIAVQPFFIKSVILPRVETATQSKIEVDGLSFSPFRSLSVSNITFARNDGSLRGEMSSAVIRYDLIKILKGTIRIDEVTLIQPDFTFTPSLSASGTPEAIPEKDSNAESTPPRLQIRNVKIQNGAFTLKQPDKTLRLQNLNFKVPELSNGKVLQPIFETQISGSSQGELSDVQMQGSLKSSLEVQLSEDLLPIELKGSLVADLDQVSPEIPAMSFKAEVDLGLDPENRTLSIKTLRADALRGSATLLELTLQKPAQMDFSQSFPTFSDTEITLRIPPVSIETLPFAEWIPLQSGDLSLESQIKISGSGTQLHAQLDFGLQKIVLPVEGEIEALRLGAAQGKGSLAWTRDADLDFDLELNAEDLKLPDGKTLPSPLQVLTKGSTSSTRAELSHVEIAWPETAGFQNRITLNGIVDWQEPQALDVEMKVRAENLDLDPWAEWIVKEKESSNTNAVTSTDPQPKENQKLNLSPLPLKQLTFNLQAQQIRLNEIRLEKIQTRLLADKSSLQLKPFSLTVNDSTFTNVVAASWRDLPLKLEITSALTPLDLQPVVDTFLPEKAGAVTGILQGNTRFQVTGSDMQELWESFNGQIEISYTEGKIKLIDTDPEQHRALLHTRKLVQEIVQALAGALKIPPESLMAPDIESVVFKSQIQDQKLSLEQARILNPEFMLDVSGSMSLQPDIGDSKIDDFPVVLGLNTNIAKRIKIYRKERVQGNYVLLPSFIEVTGTLADPRIEVKKGVITGLVISGITERNEVGNENVQSGLEVLGSLLTGEPIPVKTPVPEATPQPGAAATPTPKPGKTERILEGIQLFQQLRATPTPDPQGL